MKYEQALLPLPYYREYIDIEEEGPICMPEIWDYRTSHNMLICDVYMQWALKPARIARTQPVSFYVYKDRTYDT